MNINTLIGKTITRVEGRVGLQTITLHTKEGNIYSMTHFQECCEDVSLLDMSGCWEDIFDKTVTGAAKFTYPLSDKEASTVKADPSDAQWTFYQIETADSFIILRWLGSSNGYYGIEVGFEELTSTSE